MLPTTAAFIIYCFVLGGIGHGRDDARSPFSCYPPYFDQLLFRTIWKCCCSVLVVGLVDFLSFFVCVEGRDVTGKHFINIINNNVNTFSIKTISNTTLAIITITNTVPSAPSLRCPHVHVVKG